MRAYICGWVSIFINFLVVLEEFIVRVMEIVVIMERMRYGDELKKCLCKIILLCNFIFFSILKNMIGLEYSILGSFSFFKDFSK